MKLGIEIAQARRHAAMTQRELADKCGCTGTSISETERGRTHPREPRMLLVIAELLGVTADQLLRRIDAERGPRINAWKSL